MASHFSGRKRNFNGEQFWSRWYAVSTVGFEEAQVRKYIQDQEDQITVTKTADFDWFYQ